MATPHRSQRRHRSETLDPISTEPHTSTSRWPWTWHTIREYMGDKYGNHYPAHELRAMEVKWRKICADAGWSIKGQ
jgi:hypothetical protein